ncbi:MAG: FAD:protein FMN transferase, partial [Lachnospiraceae bacterium]|nr:FAD:protein FMN transferase [Lachnospiraceae bacterium]
MKRIAKTILISFLSVCMLASCTNKAPEHAGGLAMDTVFNITVYGEPGLATELLEAATELDEKVLNRFDEGSLISAYSSDAASMTAVVSGNETDLSDILARSEELREASYGAF